MALSAENIKFYACSNWSAEDETHGGTIDLGNEIPASGINNIFDDVSDNERQEGDVEWRKIYIRNENDQAWENVKCWIEQNTPAENDEIYISASGTNNDTWATASGYNFVKPSGLDDPDVQELGTLEPSGYHHLWIKRVVTAGGGGYANNSFQIKFAST